MNKRYLKPLRRALLLITGSNINWSTVIHKQSIITGNQNIIRVI